MGCGHPPPDYGHWTLQLLADELVALEIVDAISHETVREVLYSPKDQTCSLILAFYRLATPSSEGTVSSRAS
jgi:hypothetical protein